MQQLKQCEICKKNIHQTNSINICNVCIMNELNNAKKYIKQCIESKLHNSSCYYEENKIISDIAINLGYVVKSFQMSEDKAIYKISRGKNA